MADRLTPDIVAAYTDPAMVFAPGLVPHEDMPAIYSMALALVYLAWFSFAFHLISVTTHVATVAQPALKPLIYFALQSFWSLPLLLVMDAAGLWAYRGVFSRENLKVTWPEDLAMAESILKRRQ